VAKKTKIEQAGVSKLRISDIEMADYNPRDISEVALAGLRDSIKSYGMLEVPVVNTADGKLRCVSGHQRLKALAAEGYEFADCAVVEFDDTTEMTANLAMNNPATQGHWNPAGALEQVDGIMEQLPRPDMARFDVLREEIRAALPNPDKKEANDYIHVRGHKDVPKDAKSVLGTTYRLGKHKLFCGDITEPGAAQNLMGSKKAHACITDPPYNVDFRHGSVPNDDMDEDSWEMFLAATCKAILKVTKGACYIFMSSKCVPDLFSMWHKHGGEVNTWLAWVKDNFTPSPTDYQYQYEIIMYGSKAGLVVKHPKAKTNLLEYKRPSINTLHPTQKPVGVIKALMEDAADKGQIVFDPFGGSGTTLVVAEELGRVCYMSEIIPGFCDTIRRRWAEQVHGEGSAWEDLTPAISSA
jgi:DNA modification methylase